MLDIFSPEDGAQLAFLNVSPEFVIGFAFADDHIHKFYVKQHGLPLDCIIVKIGIREGVFRVLLKSKKFKALRLGAAIPDLTSPVFEKIQ